MSSFLKDKKEYTVLSSQLLRNMQKAVYLPQNLGPLTTTHPDDLSFLFNEFSARRGI